VKAAQEEIAKYLPDRPQYVVTTSEFDEVKARLSGIINAHRINNGNEARPTLRQRPGSEKVDTAQTDTAGSGGRASDQASGLSGRHRPLARTDPRKHTHSQRSVRSRVTGKRDDASLTVQHDGRHHRLPVRSCIHTSG